jgi:peptidoglycan/xylan/chitin deacetylase (PgdA/CDA1 family)
MAVHPDGMEHKLYPYSPLRRRPKLEWPNGARLAVCINLFFENMTHETPDGLIRDSRWKDRFAHDPRLYTWYDYGNRVAVFRILDVLDRHRLNVTVAANATACERFPYLVESFHKRGWEIAAHGVAVNGVITSRLPEDQEREYLSDSIARIERAIGERPVGWFGQDCGETTRTPYLLADLNMRYLADWANDDQPYVMPGAQGIISIPNCIEWDDMRVLWDRRLQMPRYTDIVGDALDQLYLDGAETGRFFSLNLHPWLIGAPHRIKYLERVLDKVATMPGIWQTTTREVVRQVTAGS